MTFNLDRPNSNTETYIFLRGYLEGKPFKYPTGQKIHPDKWNQETCRPTVKHDATATINRIDTRIKELESDSNIRNVPLTAGVVRAELDKLLRKDENRPKQNKADFWQVVEDIITARKEGDVLTSAGKRFSRYTIRNYNNTVVVLKAFDKRLSFQTINYNTYEKLLKFLNKEYDHSLNMIGQTVKNLRVFMKQARKDGVHNNSIYESFIIPEEETVDIFLNVEEVKLIYQHRCTTATHDLVRDWFIIDCFVGLRISDIDQLNEKNVQGDLITLFNEKTDVKVVIPIHPYVKKIRKKHGGWPRRISNQKMNENIKEVVKEVGINEVVHYSITKGGVRSDFKYEKWEMVSNHTARRSFITNLLIYGVPDTDVMKLTGIKKHSTLMRYKKESEEEIAKRMKDHKFFK